MIESWGRGPEASLQDALTLTKKTKNSSKPPGGELIHSRAQSSSKQCREHCPPCRLRKAHHKKTGGTPVPPFRGDPLGRPSQSYNPPWSRLDPAISPSRHTIIGQKKDSANPPTKGQLRYSEHIANFLKVSGRFGSGESDARGLRSRPVL